MHPYRFAQAGRYAGITAGAIFSFTLEGHELPGLLERAAIRAAYFLSDNNAPLPTPPGARWFPRQDRASQPSAIEATLHSAYLGIDGYSGLYSALRMADAAWHEKI